MRFLRLAAKLNFSLALYLRQIQRVRHDDISHEQRLQSRNGLNLARFITIGGHAEPLIQQIDQLQDSSDYIAFKGIVLGA